jgi:hypothetical protein
VGKGAKAAEQKAPKASRTGRNEAKSSRTRKQQWQAGQDDAKMSKGDQQDARSSTTQAATSKAGGQVNERAARGPRSRTREQAGQKIMNSERLLHG